MAEFIPTIIAAGSAIYSGVQQSRSASAMRSQLDGQSADVKAVEDGQRRVRMGGRGMLSFTDDNMLGGSSSGLSNTFGGATR